MLGLLQLSISREGMEGGMVWCLARCAFGERTRSEHAIHMYCTVDISYRHVYTRQRAMHDSGPFTGGIEFPSTVFSTYFGIKMTPSL